MENKNLGRALFLILVLLLAIVGFYFLRSYADLQNLQTETPSLSPTSPPTVLDLTVQNRNVVVGVPFTIEVVANSAGQDIVGFDLLVGYDKQALTLSSFTTSTPIYQVFRSDKTQSHTSLTAIKNINVKEKTVYSNNPILTLTFLPQKKGIYTISLLPKSGQETTKLVNDKVEVSQPKVEMVEVEVK